MPTNELWKSLFYFRIPHSFYRQVFLEEKSEKYVLEYISR